MSESPYLWTEALQRAIRRNKRDAHNRYLQLATVREDGTPAVRTLVFRAFCGERRELRMVTDQRSAKVDQIKARAPGEICWYLTHTREQFRLSGTLMLTGPDADDQSLREELWGGLSEAAREQFFWPTPDRPLADDLPGVERVNGDAPETFLVVALAVHAVDHLSLRGSPQTRWRSSFDGGQWTSVAVNP